MNMLKMNPEESFVLDLAKAVACLNGSPEISLPYPANWPKAKGLLAYHELTPFVYPLLRKADLNLPEDIEEFFKNDYYCALSRCQRFRQEFLRISDAFESAGITLLPIKGAALLEDIYTHIPVRPMVDIDLLVKERDIEKSQELLSSLGYKKRLDGLKEDYWRKKQCHIAFHRQGDNPFIAELHWSLDFKRKNRDILPELWNRAREIKASGQGIKLLSPEDTLFSLALHQRRMGKALCLKNTYDAVLLLNKYCSSFDWDYVVRQAKESSARATLFFLLLHAEILGFKMPALAEKGLSPAGWKKKLIQKFIGKNAFLLLRGREKEMYLKSHFLLYDTIWEPVSYILNIPQEQFSKFYEFKPYSRKTGFLYRNRIIYILFKAVLDLVKKVKNGKSFSF